MSSRIFITEKELKELESLRKQMGMQKLPMKQFILYLAEMKGKKHKYI